MTSQSSLEIARQRLLNKFSYFCQLFLDPKYYDEGFHTNLCDFFQDSIQNKLIVLPRTFLKTTVAAMYALWRATKDTGIRILVTSNTTPNAQKTVRQIRNVVENNKHYQLFFPEAIPQFGKVRWSDSCACLKRKDDYPEGTFEAAGVGANIIRRHFNIIIEDDTVAPKKDELTGEEAMPSKDDIEKAVGFHKLTIPLLINEEDERIVIGTRWASYDLINYVMENEKFDTFDKPAYNEGGVLLYKNFSMERLDMIKMALGSHMFSSLYLNQPLAKEFMTFNPDWVRYYEESELPEDGDAVVTVDPADPPTGKRSQDYSAIMSCKHTKIGIFVRRYRRERVTDKQLIAKSMDVAKTDGAIKIRIEVNRYAHLEAGFREEMAVRKEWYIIEPVKARLVAKEGRIKNRLSPLFENGVIFLKRGFRELEEELFTFPYGKHDDLIDALSWQIERYIPRDFEKEEARKPFDGRMSWSLEDILKSCRSRRGAPPYPFPRQLEGSRMS